jgi:hypothetical protein
MQSPNTKPQGKNMLKRIAFVALFLVASAISFTTSASSRPTTPSDATPKAPVGHGLCPGIRC